MPRIAKLKQLIVTNESLQKSLGPDYTLALVRQWKDTLREIARKHLDFEKSYKEQPENIAKCEQEFWQLYPEIFLTSDNNDHRRALARAYVQKVFANDRWKSMKDSARDDKEGGMLTPDDESLPSRRSPRQSTANKSENPPSSQRLVLRSRPQPTSPEMAPSASYPFRRRVVPSNANIPVFDRETTQVAHFLETCTPPMAHFLPNFLAFGCKNEDFLQAVNSWSDDGVENFLKTLGGSKFTGMDVLVLKHHFRAYFEQPLRHNLHLIH